MTNLVPFCPKRIQPARQIITAMTLFPVGLGCLRRYSLVAIPFVFRWVPMGSKREAVETEERLLENFDYAWNKELNNARCPDDIYKRLNKVDASTFWFPKITRILHGKVDIRIKARKPHRIELNSGRSNYLFSGIRNFSKLQPRYNQRNPDGDPNCKLNTYFKPEIDDAVNTPSKVGLQICSVILEDGTACIKAPVPSLKRCHDHKGRRMYSAQNALRENKYNIESEIDVQSDQHHGNGITCGVELDKGKKCSRQLVVGRKRCQEHKGIRLRVNSSVTIPPG